MVSSQPAVSVLGKTHTQPKNYSQTCLGHMTARVRVQLESLIHNKETCSSYRCQLLQTRNDFVLTGNINVEKTGLDSSLCFTGERLNGYIIHLTRATLQNESHYLQHREELHLMDIMNGQHAYVSRDWRGGLKCIKVTQSSPALL